jgi:hypothetical protein
MSHARHRMSCLALAIAAALGLSACTSTTPASKAKPSSAATDSSTSATGNSAPALFKQLQRSGATAKSVRIKGSITNGATAAAAAVTVKIDIAGDLAGKNNIALVDDGTGVMELLTVGGKTYIKADTAYWTKNGTAAIAKVAAGKYILVPAASAANMSDSTVGKLLTQIYASAAGQLSTKVVTTEVNGVPAYLLATKANDSKLYVSADGQARLLRVEGSKGQLSAWDFTEWNAVPLASAPAADQLTTLPSK